MYRQKSSEDGSNADGRSESEASKSVTSLRRPISNENSSFAPSESSKKEQNAKEKLSSFGNINLAPLTKHLYSKEDLAEDDVPWTWDSLFTEVASELRSQWEKSESKGGK